MKIYLATNNADKKREMQEILAPHTIIVPSDEGIRFNPVEDGATFHANSLIKAQALHNIVRAPVIADDSGICVNALNGAPGIYSSRWAGPEFPHGRADGSKIPQAEQNRMLIAALNAAQKSNPALSRAAHYACAMVLYLGTDRLFVAQETMEGEIVQSIDAARGTGGFGYDPIFLLPHLGRTAAELSAEEKNAVSHRGKAARALLRLAGDF